MQANHSHQYPKANQPDHAPGPSQSNSSQRLPSRPISSHASWVDLSAANGSSAGPSPPRLAPPTTPSSLRSLNTTPHKSSLRFSHPPPAPSSSYLESMTPQSKRARLIQSGSASDSSTTGTTPLSQSSNPPHRSDASSSSTGPLNSPLSSNIRPLSGISRPLPLPPTPSPSQRNSILTSHKSPLIPMPQRSIEDLQKLLPPRPPPSLRNPAQDSPRRALLQAIPPRPPLPEQATHDNAFQGVAPPSPAVETLAAKRGWSSTGFRSFDIDLDRIAEVVQQEQERIDGSSGLHDTSVSHQDATSHQTTESTRPYFGLADRGLPSGSILEVLGPPGSGKSSLVLQFAMTERLRALGKARALLSVHDDTGESGADRDGSYGTLDDSSYFSEEFWDAEVGCADQVLIIDCEGALLPERIADAAWSAVASLWTSLHDQQQKEGNTEPEISAPMIALPHQREAMPEEVRRLVAAALSGVHVSRVTSLTGLIALLHSLRPTDELTVASSRKALPTSLPPRTSLVLIDSLSYYVRSPGGNGQDRKLAAQSSERIREMLLRLQKPFEFWPQHVMPVEEQTTAKQRCKDAAAKVCTPTIVFTNQLGIRRGRNESDTSGRAGRAGPSGWQPNGTGSSRSFNKSNARNEGSSMLAPLLNGTRPPQSSRNRDERPTPSVALNGPEMWDDHEPPAASPRSLQQLNGRNIALQPMGHDRGWPPSFLGPDVWRILLFRHGSFGERYAQMVSVPPAVQSELSMLWAQTRERMRLRTCSRAETAGHDGGQRAEANTAAEEPVPNTEGAEVEKDKQMLELLSQLRASLFRWRPFHISSRGLVC